MDSEDFCKWTLLLVCRPSIEEDDVESSFTLLDEEEDFILTTNRGLSMDGLGGFLAEGIVLIFILLLPIDIYA